MLEIWHYIVIGFVFIVSLAIVTTFIIGLTVPCCNRNANNDYREYTATWGRMAQPYVNNQIDTLCVAVPPLPPYFYVNEINYDRYSASV